MLRFTCPNAICNRTIFLRVNLYSSFLYKKVFLHEVNKLKNNRLLFIFTLSFFALGFINIHFALLGLLCMGIPFYLLFKNKRKTWCQGYCPRACLYKEIGKLKPYKHKLIPNFFVKGAMKWIMLGYFGVNMLIVILSTVMVGLGKVVPIDHLRIMFVIRLPEIPQLLTITSVNWLLHFSYRFYSMMLTTSILGLVLALIYKPRTWCTICPIATVSDVYIKSKTK